MRETITVTVRQGRIEDPGEETALHRSVDWCYDDRAVVAEYHDDADEPSSVLVAELDGRVGGKPELFRAYKAQHGFFALVRRFVVHPEYRGRGVGRALLEHAVEGEREQGDAFVELTVDVNNPQAYAFYDREGFWLDRVEVVLRKSLDGQEYRSAREAQRAEWDGGTFER
jgi:GNAT superfamily N-acetyltransferase